ncbi:GA module-containing protein [Ureaplasma diversum]|uniref:GA module-containing protein n=1 Tax=Ureaplasma diversum TaxID=42094 RepID=UPI000B1C78CD|nr:GA module-containing protein [Ureaplasma diversum]
MSKFKNKKALALSVGAIMAGVSVIGVVAACAPTKAKPAKPTEKKVEQPQTGGNESSNPGSGSATNPSGQSSNNGGSANSSGGSTNTTPGATNPANPGSQGTENNPTTPPTNSSTPETIPKDPKTQDDKPSVGSGTESGSKDKTEQTPPTTEQNPKVTESPKENGTGTENKGESTDKEQSGKSGDGSQSSEDNKQQSDEEKLKAQQEAEEKKKADAEKMLSYKKISVKAQIDDLIYIPDKRLNEIKANIDKIENPSESDKLTKILDEAKEEDNKYKELNDKKEAAKKEVNALENIQQDQKDKFIEMLDKVEDISKTNDIQTILQEARKEEAKIIASKLEVTPVGSSSLTRKLDNSNGSNNYLYFRVKTTPENYEKIMKKRFVMVIDKDGKNTTNETSATFDGANNTTIYHEDVKKEDQSVAFTILSSQPYNDNESGTYKVIGLYLEGDSTKNILKGQSNSLVIPVKTNQ